jgi:hypothetical protein
MYPVNPASSRWPWQRTVQAVRQLVALRIEFNGLAHNDQQQRQPNHGLCGSLRARWALQLRIMATTVGSAIVTPPMMAAPLLGLPASYIQRGAGLTNFAVIFGGSNGIGFYALVLERRIEFHASSLGWTQTPGHDGARELLQGAASLLAQSHLSELERDGLAV